MFCHISSREQEEFHDRQFEEIALRYWPVISRISLAWPRAFYVASNPITVE
jgi:hypothetical protein